MRLLLHNLLECKVRGCKPALSYPLSLQECEFSSNPTEFNADFIKSLLFKIDYSALLKTLAQIGKLTDSLPSTMPEEPYSEEFLQDLHRILLEVNVVSGKMVCECCKHVYLITDSIPNMLLEEEEL